MKNLKFEDTTVPRRIRFGYPHKAIFHDMDGSLTEKGANTWVTPHYNFLEQPECTVDLAKYDGVYCDSTVAVRRVTFW
jgi:hypothetical protein